MLKGQKPDSIPSEQEATPPPTNDDQLDYSDICVIYWTISDTFSYSGWSCALFSGVTCI